MEFVTVSRSFRYPQTGALMRHFTDGDFLDHQIAPIPDDSLQAVDLALLSVFAMPKWVRVLLGLRNMLVRPFGLASADSENFALPTREDILEKRYDGPFAVEHVGADEVSFGSNDRHLDFRIAVLKTRMPENHVAIATWVHPHNVWGRLYLLAVLPFHKLIVWRMLANLKDCPSRRHAVTGNQANC